jgi:hypothetical protein
MLKARTTPSTRQMLHCLCAMTLTVGMAAALSACGAIPQSGPVTVGQLIKDNITNYAEYFPEGPVKDATQDQILQGFIGAFTGSQDNYAVARTFLSTKIRNTWDPRASVLIRDGSPTLATVNDTTRQYSFPSGAVINAAGAYSESAHSTPQTLTFQFVKEAGQWRISDAPPGIVLSEGIFASIFQQRTLYFLDKSHQRLVPDLRWFPARGTTQTRIATALLAGPSPWLQGAVSTAFPEGTQLAPPKSVTVTSGVAQVDLTSEARKASEQDRQLMLLQLQTSLSNVTPVSVDIFVEDSALVIPDLGASAPPTNPAVDNRVLVFHENAFGFYSNGTVTGIDGLSDKIVKLAPLGAAVDSTHSYAAVLTASGVAAVTTTTEPVLIDSRPGLIVPSLDNAGFIWSVPRASPGAIEVFDLKGVAHAVSSNLPAHSEIVSLDVARDGTRIVIYLETAAGPRMIVSAISRDDSHVPTALGEPILDVTAGSGRAYDATWVDAFSVAALSQGGAVLYVIGGQSASLGAPSNGVAIVGGNGRSGIRVLGKDGVIQVPRGSGWSSTAVAVTFIATQH